MTNKRLLIITLLITILLEIIYSTINPIVLATEANTIKLNFTKYKFENLNSNIQLQASFTGETEKITWKSDN